MKVAIVHDWLVTNAGAEKVLKQIAKENVEVLGYQEDKVLVDYMQRAKAFVYAAVEDFGIVPIEAFACGTPMIALNDGGTAESVIDGVNGVHFQNQTIQDIKQAVNQFESLDFDILDIRNSTFKYVDFKYSFKSFVDKYIN